MNEIRSSQPLVSVIIPTYNTGKYLIESIESALNQSWANKEVIVVDDGSTDDTKSMLEPYFDRIIYIYQNNQGEGVARNTGLKFSKGEFITFLDADDLLLPRFIETMLKAASENSKVDVLYCWWSFIDQNGQTLPEQGRYTGKGDLFYSYVLSNNFPVMAALTRKQCIEAVGGFDETRFISEDWDLWLRIAQKGYYFDFLPEVLVKYRFHGSNMTLNVERNHSQYVAVLDKLYRSEQLPPDVVALKSQAFSQIFLTKVLYHSSQGDYSSGWEALREAVLIWPELICQEETFHRLACAEQPPGYRDTTWFRDLPKMERQIDKWLNDLLQEPALKLKVVKYRKLAKAKMAMAMANLYYQSNNRSGAIRLLFQSLVNSPLLMINRRVIGLCIRLFLGKKIIQRLKRLLFLENTLLKRFSSTTEP